MNNRAVIYARFSSDRQRKESIEQQVKVCKAYCEREGLDVVNVYADHAITGRTDERPQFQKMVADSATNTFRYVVVYSLDRFSRDVYDSCKYELDLKKNNVCLLSATEQIDNTPTGDLMKNMMRTFAQYYVEELSQKIRRGLDDNASKFLCNGKPPYGYDRGPNGEYVVNEDEAEIVREIFNRVLDHESFADIFRSLNSRCLKTKHGKEWNRSSFNKLLSNKKYIGTYEYKGTETEDAIPAIVPKTTFHAVQQLLPEKKNGRGNTVRRRNENGVYLLSGKLFCGNCGEMMTGKSGTGKHGELHYYYVCKGKKNGSDCSCKNMNREYLEGLISRKLVKFILDDEAVEWVAEEMEKYIKNDPLDAERRMVVKDIETIKKEIENGVNALLKIGWSEALQDKLSKKEAELKKLESRYESLKVYDFEKPSKDDIISFIKLFRDGMIQADPSKYVLDTFVSRIDLYDDHLDVFYVIKKEPHHVSFDVSGDGWVRLTQLSGDKKGLSEPVLYRDGVFNLRISLLPA